MQRRRIKDGLAVGDLVSVFRVRDGKRTGEETLGLVEQVSAFSIVVQYEDFDNEDVIGSFYFNTLDWHVNYRRRFGDGDKLIQVYYSEISEDE